jgi:hypothetical protein
MLYRNAKKMLKLLEKNILYLQYAHRSKEQDPAGKPAFFKQEVVLKTVKFSCRILWEIDWVSLLFVSDFVSTCSCSEWISD